MAKDEILRRAVAGVERARRFATTSSSRRRTPPAPNWTFWPRCRARHRRRATTVNIPDTVGYACRSSTPAPSAPAQPRRQHRQGSHQRALPQRPRHGGRNSLAALHEGARQVECTTTASASGPATGALEEVVMAIKTRATTSG